MLNFPKPEPGHHLGRLTYDYPPEDRPFQLAADGFVMVYDRSRFIGILSDNEAIHQFIQRKPAHRRYRMVLYFGSGRIFQRWLVWRDWDGGVWFLQMMLRRRNRRRRSDR